jgi:hypothetical protein
MHEHINGSPLRNVQDQAVALRNGLEDIVRCVEHWKEQPSGKSFPLPPPSGQQN